MALGHQNTQPVRQPLFVNRWQFQIVRRAERGNRRTLGGRFDLFTGRERNDFERIYTVA